MTKRLPTLTKPDVFIIESLNIPDEEHRREGEIIFRSLKMSGKNPIYRYLRTRTELEHFVKEFKESSYRYLHVSCHGDIDNFATTFDDMDNEEFSSILGSCLDGRRLFLSTCLAATSPFAKALFSKSSCHSVAGPAGKIAFDDSAVFWTGFYHLMFKENARLMTNANAILNLTKCAQLIDRRFHYFYQDKTKKFYSKALPKRG